VVAIGHPADLVQNPLLRGWRVLLGLTAAVPLDEGSEPVPVEACDQVGDRIATAAPRRPGGSFIARAVGHREQFRRPCHLRCRIGPRAAQPLQVVTFMRHEGTQGILLVRGHGRLQGGEIDGIVLPAYADSPRLATTKPNDPLVVRP
jgi:hypothetical protein